MATQVAKWRLSLLILFLFIYQDLTNCLGPVSAPASSPTPSLAPPLPPPPPPLAPVHPPPFDPLPGGSKKGMSGGQKAGIAIGVIAAAGVVGLGGKVYQKRRRNTRRAMLGSAARRAAL